ncbi:capsular biosynthesis protein [Cytobacillus suaedae]|nr:capsular biosynthesis protein [Cytobacillus suaedae]
MSEKYNPSNYEGKVKEINLKEYVDIIRKRLWIIILLTMLTTAAGYFYSKNNTPVTQYQTSTRVILEAEPDTVNTLMVMIKDPLILDKVIAQLGLSKSSGALANQINIGSVNDSQILNITVVDTNPQMAVEIANTTIEVFRNEITGILGLFLNVKVISEAQDAFPLEQQSSNLVLIMFALGVILGIGFVFLLDSLDNTIRSEQEIEKYLGAPVLGFIPKMKKRNTTVKRKKRKEIVMRGETIDTN